MTRSNPTVDGVEVLAHDEPEEGEGHVVIEFGPGGREALRACAGDLVHVEPGELHRTRDPTAEDAVLLPVLVGSGPLAVGVGEPPGG